MPPEDDLMPYRVLLLLATLGAAACTMLTAEQRSAACQATDWASYGRNDGILGVASSERVEKFADCAELGHPADIAAYQAARAEGLATYCSLENGYDVGYAGRRYRNACPPELEIAFLQGYEQGRKEQPASYYPYYGFGFGYYSYPYFGYRFGHHRHRHRGHRRHHRGSKR
jgi:hypothetical protein